jgi:hypothetical protein
VPRAKAKIGEGIVSEVGRRTRSSMQDGGFKSRGGMFFAPTADPEVSRRVAFGHISYDADGIYKVQPFVGVRWESLERLLTEWTLQADDVDPNIEHDARRAAATSVTLNINPGYLGPEERFRVFAMPSLDAVPSLVSAMVEEVLVRGAGLWDQFGTPASILRALEDKLHCVVPMDSGSRLPVAFHLLGRDEDALAVLPELAHRVVGVEGPWAEMMHRLIANIRRTAEG